MKVKNLCLLAGATAAFVTAGAMATPVLSISDPVLNVLAPTSNNPAGLYQTVTISLTGVTANSIGILNVASHPFLMQTDNGSKFYNVDGFGTGSPFAATPATGDPLSVDSGFLGPNFTGFGSSWGAPSTDMESWALNGTPITSYTGPGFWITLDETGIPAPPDGVINLFRVTWDALTGASGQFLYSDVVGGGSEYAYEWSVPAIPAPGALALLGIAGLIGARRRRA